MDTYDFWYNDYIDSVVTLREKRMITYSLLGDPIPLSRPRFSVAKNHIYNSQKTRQLVDQINIKEQHGNNSLFDGPLSMEITFFMPIPKMNRTKKIKSGDFHVYKPDVDNLAKYCIDICQSVLFKDDCSISQLKVTKIYDINPRTEFKVWAIV